MAFITPILTRLKNYSTALLVRLLYGILQEWVNKRGNYG